MESQTTSQILMVKPIQFNYNTQTATNNAFQQVNDNISPAIIQAQALKAFEAMVEKLIEKQVEVWVIEDTPEPQTPDAIFPNNWITTHADGTVVLYPMFAPNRRLERKPHILTKLQEKFTVTNFIDFTASEQENKFLEGTGSLILDRPHKIAYACFSQRTHPELLAQFSDKLGYEIVAFEAVDAQGKAIYHTNVMMCVGETFAVICEEAIIQPKEKALVLEKLQKTGKTVVPITFKQMERFAGNMLHIRNKKGQGLLVMSETAFSALTSEQEAILKKHAELVAFPIDIIEQNGGGSVRCMIAEIFLQNRE